MTRETTARPNATPAALQCDLAEQRYLNRDKIEPREIFVRVFAPQQICHWKLGRYVAYELHKRTLNQSCVRVQRIF